MEVTATAMKSQKRCINNDRRRSKTTLSTMKANDCSGSNRTIPTTGFVAVVAVAIVSLLSISTSYRIVIPVDALVCLNHRKSPVEIGQRRRWQRNKQDKYNTRPSFASPTRIQRRQSSVSDLASASEFPSEISPSSLANDHPNDPSDSAAAAGVCDASDDCDDEDEQDASLSDSSSVFSPAAPQTQAFGNHEISHRGSEPEPEPVPMPVPVSKTSERKRYDAELEEAFAQQTRERNPLLGVKSIGVDYGLVRTGVAVTIGYNPEALDVIVTENPMMLSLRGENKTGTTDAASDGQPNDEQARREEERRLEAQRQTVAERVVEWASRENADRIVVGLPLHKNGTEAPQTALTRKFARDHLAVAVLRTLGPTVSVYLSDERYTSKEAAARMRSSPQSNNKINNNNDLYGLLDAESAKIILEQYYDDHIDRYSNRNSSDTGSNKAAAATTTTDKSIHSGGHYNGEIVTIPDDDLVEALTLEYNERKRLERERLAADRIDREARARWRKQAMEDDRKRAEEQRRETAADGGVSTSKKKKKKKKKRRRK